uniref:Uncharacterized protein n=1 Tax=Triticum urartu TaxID=4572 RepID=A0A8R7QKA3_TRIUA
MYLLHCCRLSRSKLADWSDKQDVIRYMFYFSVFNFTQTLLR